MLPESAYDSSIAITLKSIGGKIPVEALRLVTKLSILFCSTHNSILLLLVCWDMFGSYSTRMPQQNIPLIYFSWGLLACLLKPAELEQEWALNFYFFCILRVILIKNAMIFGQHSFVSCFQKCAKATSRVLCQLDKFNYFPILITRDLHH